MSLVIFRRVDGNSMSPTLPHGTFVLGMKSRQYHDGDIVMARLAKREVIKRIKWVDEKRCYLVGDNLLESVDSREYGPIPIQEISAKLVWPRIH
jgi:phage repressor protein C with HTH and peptisase S24 domain